MSLNARQSTESRQSEIIATVVALAAERNPAEVTTTDIAKAMSVTQGALFRHFPTKEAIRLAVIEWVETQLMANLADAQASAPDVLSGLEAMFLAHVKFIRQFPGVPRLVFAELQQPDSSPLRQRVQQIMQRYRQMLAEALGKAKAAHLIRDDVDVQAAAVLFLGAIQGLVMQSMLGGVSPDAEEPVLGVLRLYLASLGGKS
ncbi:MULTISPECIES: TetR/AcrR family transcriptional regulator [Betaproteobacteria]|jgi:AcrR family transcriptional regulator|uniref:TetR/AcrR family transcriptional regulator n=1 Tax=Betaproteobacteria TaxID=28216 RepID=UPI001290B33E|nr:TetR/AcrR family transcriptional regulator [Accumulibacter sp.]HMW57726.1 TetR/AcrR family transcriptional regulator [Accumulibacter sp.]HMZ99004.1 TetR/AcrR family transcriptional regulator [Nitrospira sp.]HNM20062.1 TetR/AcrR family transcriptional regulator [Nitrospira sp.]HNO58903.1 TetR/AcrR family transcriptional regulator [Accumulibacter sp.]